MRYHDLIDQDHRVNIIKCVFHSIVCSLTINEVRAYPKVIKLDRE